MYAVVQFKRRKLAVVPLNWLIEDQKLSYWPSNKCRNEAEFDEFVVSCKQPLSSWPKYGVTKVHEISDNYTNACASLQTAVEESSTSDSGEKPSEDPLKELKSFFKGKQPEPTNKRKRSSSESSFSNNDFSDQANETVSDEHGNSSMGNVSHMSSPMISQIREGVASNDVPITTDRHLLETILRRVERIVSVQDQHSLVLNNILAINQSTSLQALQRPADMPMLPINCKADYKSLEEFLQNEEKYKYMKCRLACIGGANVRNATMNMLKFLVTDKVAMHFNWAGRGEEKRPFKNTSMTRVIKDAILTSYGKGDHKPADLSDINIENAIKDWLKLAKSRFNSAKRSSGSKN